MCNYLCPLYIRRMLSRVAVLKYPYTNTEVRLTNICHSICQLLEWWIMPITELTISGRGLFAKRRLNCSCFSLAISKFQYSGSHQFECKWKTSYELQQRDIAIYVKKDGNNNKFTRRLTCPSACIFSVTRRVLIRTKNVITTNISYVRPVTTFRIGENIW